MKSIKWPGLYNRLVLLMAGVVEQDPLALMDAASLDYKDLVKTEIHFRDMKTV